MTSTLALVVASLSGAHGLRGNKVVEWLRLKVFCLAGPNYNNRCTKVLSINYTRLRSGLRPHAPCTPTINVEGRRYVVDLRLKLVCFAVVAL